MKSEVFIIYADIFLLIHFIMDFLCLFITGRLTGGGIKAARLVCASLAGAVYSLGYYYFYPLPVYIIIMAHTASAVLLCVIAFKRRSVKSLLGASAVFILSSSLMGGILNAAYAFAGKSAEGGYGQAGAFTLLAAASFATAAALAYSFYCKKKSAVRSMRADITVGGITVKSDLLVDSGNMLTEPFSALPVIIIRAAALPEPYCVPELETSPVPLRVIPVRGVSGSGMLLGFKPEKIILRPLLGRQKEVTAVIAADAAAKDFCGYDGLLPHSLI